MQAAYSMGPGDLNARKQALIKKLSGQNRGQGGAARLSAATPFGALPRLGFNPNARSVFGRNERFNFDGGPPGFQGAVDQLANAGGAFAPPAQAQGQMAPLGGVGPAAGQGSGSPGLPQGGGSSMSAPGEASVWHLLGQDNSGPGGTQVNTATGQPDPHSASQIPINVMNAMQSGAMSGGVNAWLRQNPWALDMLMGGGFSGGGQVL